MSNKKKVLSLFSCGGGMDIGFEGGFTIPKCCLNTDIHPDWISKEDEKYYYLKETDFETIFANDINPYAKRTWVDYFNRKRKRDISEVYILDSIVDIVKKYRNGEISILPIDVDIVTGGFPCQDFSVAGKRKGFMSSVSHNGEKVDDNIPTDENRGKLYIWMKEIIEITQPKVFIAENVKGLANLGEVKDIIQKDFSGSSKKEYIVLTPQILHAGRYGVPQNRERIIFIGFRKDALTEEALEMLKESLPFDEVSPYPAPTHYVESDIVDLYYETSSLLKPYVPCGKVLCDLVEPDNSTDLSQMSFSKAKYLEKLQGNTEVKLHRLAPTIRSEHHGNIEFRRLSKDHGSTNNEFMLPERRLTLRECARIQTFPDDYSFVLKENNKLKVSPSAGYKIVGNAVPPLLAYHIASKIRKNWSFYFGED